MIRITHVLCPVDFSETSQHALDHASAIASWYDARLTVLYVFANLPTLDLPPLVLEDADRARLMTALKEMARRVPTTVHTEFMIQEAPFVHDEVLAQIAGTHADLLVLGTHGRSGFQRLFLGSVTEKVMRKAPCPALVVPPRAPDVPPRCAGAVQADDLRRRLFGQFAVGAGLRTDAGRGSRRSRDAAARDRNAATHHVIRAAACPVLIVRRS